MWSKKYITDEQIISAAKDNDSMNKAACSLKIKFSTFIRRAKKLNVYFPNQGRIGKARNGEIKPKYKLEDILQGKHPHYCSVALKARLLKEGLKINKCEDCGISEWNNKPLKCEMHHVDGDHTNHKFINLKMVCPNCHSQTDSFSRTKERMKKFEK